MPKVLINIVNFLLASMNFWSFLDKFYQVFQISSMQKFYLNRAYFVLWDTWQRLIWKIGKLMRKLPVINCIYGKNGHNLGVVSEFWCFNILYGLRSLRLFQFHFIKRSVLPKGYSFMVHYFHQHAVCKVRKIHFRSFGIYRMGLQFLGL